MLGNMWRIHEGEARRSRSFLGRTCARCEERELSLRPHQRAVLRLSHGQLAARRSIACDLVQGWNEKYAWPKLRLSTAQRVPGLRREGARRRAAGASPGLAGLVDRRLRLRGARDARSRETETAMQVNHGLLAMASILGAQLSPETMHRAGGNPGQSAVLPRAHLRRRREHRRSAGRKHAGAVGREGVLRLDRGEGCQPAARGGVRAVAGFPAARRRAHARGLQHAELAAVRPGAGVH